MLLQIPDTSTTFCWLVQKNTKLSTHYIQNPKPRQTTRSTILIDSSQPHLGTHEHPIQCQKLCWVLYQHAYLQGEKCQKLHRKGKTSPRKAMSEAMPCSRLFRLLSGNGTPTSRNPSCSKKLTTLASWAPARKEPNKLLKQHAPADTGSTG